MESETQNTSSLGSKTVIIILVVVLVLGYILYRQVVKLGAPAPQEQETVTETAPAQNEAPGQVTGEFNFPPISADERAVLDMVANKEDQTDATAYMALVTKTAKKEGSQIALGADGRVSPVVLKVGMGGEILIKNYDSTPHAFATLDGTLSFTVPAKESVAVPVNAANFGTASGAHAYRWDNAGPAGVVWVSE